MNDKLIKIQQELKAPKSNTNSFGNYKYRSAEDILEAVKPLVHKEGLTLILSDEVENIGNANYVKATATIMDKEEHRLWVHAYAREAVVKKGMDDAQITGSASSYARKYALGGMFAIDDTKDPDGHDNRDYKPAVKKVDTVAIAKDSLNKMLESYGHDNTVKKKLIINKPAVKKVDTVAIAKDSLNKMLESYGHDNTVKKKLIINKVLEKSTVDTEHDANEVMQALEDGTV